MWEFVKNRFKQGYRTFPFPPEEEVLPERFRGRFQIKPDLCSKACKKCAEVCPTEAIQLEPLTLNLGRCVFCEECTTACPTGAITKTRDYRLSTRRKEDLHLKGQELKLAEALDQKMKKLFGRSLKLRQVCAGGCNGCEQELNALGNVVFDLSRFGIQFVASPRHADGLLVTGPVTKNMKAALQKTYDAVSDPKIVIAAGACAIQGGPFEGSDEVMNGADAVLPVDLYIAGCPPHPLTILDGLIRLLGKI